MPLTTNEELEEQWSLWVINHNGQPPRFAYCSFETVARLMSQSMAIIDPAKPEPIYGGVTKVVAVNPKEMGPVFGPFLERGGIYLSNLDKDEKAPPKKKAKRFGFWRR